MEADETADLSVAKMWRYPVKSMQGESLERVEVTAAGLKLDRTWAVRDEETATIRGAKYLPALLLCSARYTEHVSAEGVLHVEVTFPNGETYSSDNPRIHVRLSELLNKRVRLWPLQPASDLQFYRNHALQGGDVLQEFRKQFGLLESEPLPSLMQNLPLDVLRSAAEFSAPPGSFFDGPSLNLLTEASLRTLQGRLPDSMMPVDRFRPNILIADGRNQTALLEDAWIGRSIKIGEQVQATITMKCPRCVMVSRQLPNAPRDTAITRMLVREFDFCLSVYGSVEATGQISLGDPITVQ